MTMFTLLLAFQLTGGAAAQPSQAQSLFESGKYDALLQLVNEDQSAPPEDVYLAGQAALKIEPPDREAARQACARLEGGGAGAWAFIARSARALVDHAADEALAAAVQAAEAAPDLMFAHYQLGLAYGEKRNMASAAAAFDKAAALNPSFAYAHYYAGMSYYQAKRVDRMAISFERFLRLAPEAPEAPAVQAIMRSIRR